MVEFCADLKLLEKRDGKKGQVHWSLLGDTKNELEASAWVKIPLGLGFALTNGFESNGPTQPSPVAILSFLSSSEQTVRSGQAFV